MADSDSEQKILEQFDNLVSDGAICISDSSSDEEDERPTADKASQTEAIHVESFVTTRPTLLSRSVSESLPEMLRQTAGGRRGSPQLFEPLAFPDGAIRLTHMLGEPHRGRDDRWITFKELVQPGKLTKALLTTFVLDMEWLLPQLSESTKVVVVKSYRPQEESRGVYQSQNGRVTIVHPVFGEQQRYPIMHSKIMMLFYPTYVRLVVSSANLIEIDWTVLENILFIQDVRLDTGRVFPETEFGTCLAQSLRDLSVPGQVVAQISHMDLSRVSVHIVTSVPSTVPRSPGQNTPAYGLLRLSQVARQMRRSSEATPDVTSAEVYCYGSSLGKLSTSYLRDFYCCALGTTWNEMVRQNGRDCTALSISRRVKVGFHTNDQGNTNRHGSMSRACIKCFPQAFYSDSFPSYAMHKIQPIIPEVLVHAKVMLMRSPGSLEKNRGWMYLGSHNFTSGAWGCLKSSMQQMAYLNNYEFGVVIPNIHFETAFGRDSVTWRGSKVPLPFSLEWSQYAKNDIPCFTETS